MGKITKEDQKLINKVAEQSRCVLQWWFEFAHNIEKQGWISDKQRTKLATFDYDREMSRAYGCRRGRKPQKRWTSGLDTDDMSDYTGEPCAMEFYS